MDAANDLATDNQPVDPYADMRNARPWLDEIQDAEKCFQEYQDKCDNIDKAYADLKSLSGANAERQMQIFWANLEVLKPSIYARAPVPVVGSRFKDRKALNRHASEILERSLLTSFDTQDIDETMKAIRDDLATNARGVMWLRFEEGENGERQASAYDHVDRKDFVHDPARKWKEVGWVARRSWLTMERMRMRFEQTSGDAYMKASYSERKGKDENYAGEKKACVWELWHKEKNVVVWATPGVDVVLDIREPYLQLDRFFPCPRPAYGTVERGTLKPVPDFVYYKDQIEEINELTARISALSESLRMKGFYSAGGEDVADAIETAIKQNDNQAILIPVPNVAAFGGGGSFKDSIIWMPVDQVAAVIAQLIQLRKQLIDDVYQITGLSDIMRGATDPNETLGAQELKSQYGNVRIRDRQEEMIRIARDAARISGEIMAENFSMQTLMEMSQYEDIPTQAAVQQQIMGIRQQIAQAASNPQMVAQAQQNPDMAQKMLQQSQQKTQELQQSITWEQVMAFLRDQRMRPFALDIETDSTIQPDENAAKQRVTEFLTAMAPLIQQLGAMVAADPASANFAGEVLKFAASPFRAGRALEAAIDELVDQMKQKASQPKSDPAAEQMQAETQMKMQELQLKNNEMQLKAQESQASMQIELQQARAELEKTNAEIKKVYAEIERINKQAEAAVVTAQAKASQPERAMQ
ncbi:hypothetical protein CO670_15475 [Rhizobium sp. J15]|nr:hypothetical protein CO670_15475 [Rhizobium sp. J15]